uniref:Uncharacterized protein n=1 Tax=Coccidioides posadasii RMSCC 3488 TaxID=454284 RepID=A0A0J6FDF9_COCPO|nr:hypothetical protein CPAG_04672 [Coccidioides posadasii RMSCC 3488]
MFDEQSSGILLPPSPALWIPQPNTPAECAIICPPVPIAIEQIANRLENAGAAHNKLHHTAHTAKSPHTWAAHLACLPTAPASCSFAVLAYTYAQLSGWQKPEVFTLPSDGITTTSLPPPAGVICRLLLILPKDSHDTPREDIRSSFALSIPPNDVC